MKAILIITGFCLIFNGLTAQEVIPGFKVGVNGAQLSNDNADSRISGHIGFFIHTKIQKNWAFQPELLYSGEGDHYVFAGSDYNLALDYIRIPLMFQYYPVKPLYLELGPQLGYLVSARIKGPGGYKDDVYDGYHKVDIGLNFGIGVNTNNMLGFYFRYSVGLSDVTPYDHYTYSNRVAQLGATVRLK